MFDSGYLAHFLSERDENWQGYGSGQSTLTPRILWTFQESRDAIHILHCVLKIFFCLWYHVINVLQLLRACTLSISYRIVS